MTRVATVENEGELLELARVCTAAQLERAVRAHRRVTTGEARELQQDAYLSVFWEDDGSLSIRGRLAPENGALLLRALEAMRDRSWREGRGSAEPRPARQASCVASDFPTGLIGLPASPSGAGSQRIFDSVNAAASR